jgi:ubiquinone/menaquinone biosynthesis C-methylase UbiE
VNPPREGPPEAVDTERVRAHYERPEQAEGLAGLYTARTPLGEFYRDRMARIRRLLGNARGDLLDAGCGTGQMLRYLHETVPGRFRLCGLDLSAANIAVAHGLFQEAEQPRLIVGRMEQMPFDHSSFDVVLAMGSLEYVESVDLALGEIARVTRPGGIAVVTMQNPLSPYRLWDRKVWAPINRRLGNRESPILHRLRSKELEAALARAGLAAEAVERYNFNVLLRPLDAKLPRVAVAVQHGLDRASRGPLRAWSNDYAVATRRVEGSAPPLLAREATG